jgi:hypothetical protein
MLFYWNQLLSFACNWFILLFAICMTMFVPLKGRKRCFLVKFLFQEGAYVVIYLVLKNHKYLNYINNNMLAIDEFVGLSNFQSKFLSQNDTM